MKIEAVLVDTGPLIALYDKNDPQHEKCCEQAKSLPVGKTYTCWPVLTEAAYRLRNYPIQRAELFSAIRDSIYQLLSLDATDVDGMERVFATFHDQDVDLADAALVHLAGLEQIHRIFTLDRRHFHVYRTIDVHALDVVPS